MTPRLRGPRPAAVPDAPAAPRATAVATAVATADVGPAVRAAGMTALTEAGTAVEEDTETSEGTRLADAWVTIVWNDPVNLMTYVSYVFESYFGYTPQRAQRLMMQVHQEGRAVVASGPRERMEVDVQAMHGFGLWATMQRGGDA